MYINDIKKNIDLALGKFYISDVVLLENGASEWTIAHRIAVYLEDLFKGWEIDCEYNRIGIDNNPKKDSEGKRRRPDIIIHHRGEVKRDHNLLVIEVKIKETDSDFSKLKDYISPPTGKRKFQYQYGLALSFKPSQKQTWFHGTK